MLKRLFLAVLLLAAASRAGAVDFTDIWYNPAENGWGVNVVQGNAFIFLTFFIYGADGKPTWFTAQVTQDASGNFNGPLYATTGTYYILPWTGFSIAQAGTVSFRPTGPATATLIYTVTGVGPVTKTIQRQNLPAIPVGACLLQDGTVGPCTYIGGQSGAYSNCSVSTNNGSYTDFFNLQVTQLTNGSVTFAFTYQAFSCTFSGTLVQQGQLYSVPGASYQCGTDPAFSANLTQIKATAQGIEGVFSAPVGGNCREDAHFSGVLN
ncbi:MAG TPA: hypothetical protein VN326_02300 [Casimicrobiaceae bacterium]|jgi:hypothetical protein|nr:hypothetical protein [Casimicrobiaceae bacterium]